MDALLPLHDLDERERPRHQEHGHEREAHRHFVGHQLRRRAQAAEQRVLVVRGPAAEDDPVDADRRQREQEQEPDVDVGDVERRRELAGQPQLRPERDQGERRQRRDHREHRREEVNDLLRAGRRDVLLGDELDEVRQALERPLRAHAVGAEARLHEAHQPPLGEHDHEADDRRHRRDEQHDLDVGQHRRGQDLHRSTSPSTMSIVPISATRSEMRWPLASRGRACRLMNDGGRQCSRYGRLRPVGDAVEAELALGRLDRGVHLFGDRLDDARDLAADLARLEPLEALLQDAHALAHLLDADDVAVVRVAVGARRNRRSRARRSTRRAARGAGPTRGPSRAGSAR